MSAPSSSGNGGYRDEREAALAQVESLRQRVAALEPECQRLREENDVLRREVARLGGVVGPRRSGVATPIIVVLAAVVAMMFVGGALAFFLVRAPETTPSSTVPVPVSAPMPSTIVPSTTPPSSVPPVQPMLPSSYAPHAIPSGT
jgi:hypothetical protein